MLAVPGVDSVVVGVFGLVYLGMMLGSLPRLAIDAVKRISRAIGIPERLRDLGAKESQLPEFAAKAFAIKRLMHTNPRMPTEAELLALLKEAY